MSILFGGTYEMSLGGFPCIRGCTTFCEQVKKQIEIYYGLAGA
jgi:hypothetical protein